MEKELGFKELYDMHLKLTYPIEILGKVFEEGETIALFDKITISNFNEIKNKIRTSGGYNNQDRVFWEETKEVTVNFSNGIFSKEQFALLSNSKILKYTKTPIKVTQTENNLESDENGLVTLKYIPADKLFLYDKETQEKINYSKVEDKVYKINTPFTNIRAIYNFNYTNGGEKVVIGQQLISGFLSLEAKTKTQDDVTGHIKTGIIKIPKVKLMSDLSMTLGENASPMVANFSLVGIPVGSRGNKIVLEQYFLNDDIDSDL